MNPFDLPGPAFLVFYMALGVVVTVTLFFRRRQAESGTPPKIDCSDPYLIAYLRGGKNEALRVAAISLIDRGLLKVDETNLVVAHESVGDLVRRPIEKALLREFQTPDEATSIFNSGDLAASCVEHEQTLTGFNLLPDATTKAARWRSFFIALALLWGVALVKILVAISRGRSNIAYLLVLAIAFAFFAFRAMHPFRTARGNILLADLRTLFASLKTRAASLRPGGATNELALLAAVFGIGAVSEIAFPYAKKLYPKASSGSSSSSSSCGSACGSSCGGGDGGGCGGCGGGD